MRSLSPTKTGAKMPVVDLRERLRGLPPAAAVLMREVIRLHAAGDRMIWPLRLLEASELASDHPEILFWQGLRFGENGDWAAAAKTLSRAAAQRAGDFDLWLLLGTAQGHDSDAVAARRSLSQAAGCARTAADWLRLSIESDEQGFYEDALTAVERSLLLDKRSTTALLQRSRCNKALGNAEAAAADCRELIAADREVARAWFALVDLKTIPLSDAERGQLEAAAARPTLSAADRQLLDFALGKALEDAGDFAAALAVLTRANAAVRATSPWSQPTFSRRLSELAEAFAANAVAQALPQGREVIFIVGLPRSGSTLIEQVLAAHSAVEGASELPYLPQVIDAESRRRGRPFPSWASQASTEDWTRLGQDYLRRSAGWRRDKPIATDKLPDNWMLAGAIRAMLPEARIIDCRRDPVETCWSCYKQLFAPGLANFSYDFASLAQYWHACEQMLDGLAAQHPQHVRLQSYEALVTEPEDQIRALLEFCQLPFEAACVQFQTATRAIRTPSALQVRQPMRQVSKPAERFGTLLDSLRAALDHVRSHNTA